MKNPISFLIILFCSLALVSCQNMSQQDFGTLGGGVAGGLLGSTIGGGDGRLVAIAAGTLAGAMLGGSVGRSMDRNDRARVNQALETQPVGQPAYWHSEKTGARYKVVPTRNVEVHGNKYCREYQTTATVAGKQQQVYGTACRQPDGTWKAVK